MTNEVNRVLLLGVGGDGGAAQYSAQLANGLATQVETYVLLPDYINTEFENLLDATVMTSKYSMPAERSMVSVLFPSLVSSIRTQLGILRSIIKQIRTVNPDIVHIPFYTLGPLRAYFLPVLKAMRLPVVGTVHDPQLHTGQESHVLGVNVHEKGRVLGGLLIDRILVHGPETKKQAIQAGYRKESIRVVPHGIYTRFPGSDAETDPNRLLFFGNIRENKGYDRIPGIVDRVSKRRPEISAVVAGELSSSAGEVWSERALQQLRNHDRIELRQGYASMEETAELFNRAAAVVLPYYDATTSGVLMVSYRYNTPVVTTDVGDVGSYVRQDGTGLVANSNSVEDIAEATERIIIDEDCRQWVLSNLREANKRYSWESIAKETVEIYRDIVL